MFNYAASKVAFLDDPAKRETFETVKGTLRLWPFLKAIHIVLYIWLIWLRVTTMPHDKMTRSNIKSLSFLLHDLLSKIHVMSHYIYFQSETNLIILISEHKKDSLLANLFTRRYRHCLLSDSLWAQCLYLLVRKTRKEETFMKEEEQDRCRNRWHGPYCYFCWD